MIASTIIGGIGALAGTATSIYGAVQQRKAAKEREKLLNEQKASNEDWYRRNYYQDYMNSIEAQNAMKNYRNAWDDRVKEARARQAIAGGSEEAVTAVTEAGGEAMGNLMGNLAAQGSANKNLVDAQKMEMDNNMYSQQIDIADRRQQAGANLIANGIDTATSSLQGIDWEGLSEWKKKK